MRDLSVTHTFTVEVTDYVEFDEPLYTREQARELLEDVLYRGDKHAPFSLTVVGG